MEEKTKEEVLKHYYEIAGCYLKGLGKTKNFDEFDIINEPLNNFYLRNKFGWDLYSDIYKMCKNINPNIELWLNETGIAGQEAAWGTTQSICELVKRLQALGADIDGIGVQCHAGGFRYPQTFYNQLDMQAQTVDKVAVTEYDYSVNLEDLDEKAEIEAEVLRDYMIATYSHPKATGFTMWGCTDLGHSRNNSPLFDSDFNPKKGLEYWNEYVWDKWFTRTDGVTDSSGRCSLRGHRGEYSIVITAGDKQAKTTLRVTDKGENTVSAVVHGDSIELVSSEEVPASMKEKVNFTQYRNNLADYKTEYKKMSENMIANVKGENNISANYLLDESNGLTCIISNDNKHVVAELKENYYKVA